MFEEDKLIIKMSELEKLIPKKDKELIINTV